jgi:hypothetical protein
LILHLYHLEYSKWWKVTKIIFLHWNGSKGQLSGCHWYLWERERERERWCLGFMRTRRKICLYTTCAQDIWGT